MFKNYFVTAWRNLTRNLSFSLINMSGLALGIACSLLISLWVHDERSIDSFHENDEYLYTVFERQYHDGVIDAGYHTPGLLASELKNVFPEIKYSTSQAWSEENTFEANGKIMKVKGEYGSPDFFSVFSYRLIQGDAVNALKNSVDIAISEKMAIDFFGSAEAAFGQTLRFQDSKDLKVSAVFANLGVNTSHKFDYLVNWETFLERNFWAKDWGNNGPSTHLVFHPGTDVQSFETKMRDFISRYDKSQNENFIIKLALQKYSDRYLYSQFKDGEIVGGRILYVRLFTAIAVFILVIACINFMNLTTARSLKRSKEIGVRKVIGAFRGALIRQFIGEAFLIVVIAFLVALILVIGILPVFNMVTQKQIALPIFDLYFWFSLAGLALLTGIIAGSYPALYLSSFNPVRAFKGSLKFGKSALFFRKGLVVFQFVLSIILVIGTIVISRQINYVQSMNLGYDRENLIYIPLEGVLPEKYPVFKNKALSIQGVEMVSRITQNPTSIDNGTGGVVWEGKDPTSVLQFTQAAVGYDFVKTMKLQILQGRDFSSDFATDSVGYIVNEKALALFNYKDPIGMPLTFWGRKGTIIGIVKDFHFNSLHVDIKPLVLRLGEVRGWGSALIRVAPGKTQDVLAKLETITRELNPQFPFTYQFSDQEYQRLYVSEKIVGKLSNVFAFLGIFISCLGLLGLAMFTAEQKAKEIGIRKILGASMGSLFHLLSREFFVLVIIALLIASPLAWYVMDGWLNEYAYRIDIAWWIFVGAGGIAILITLATISFQTIKALVVNPVNSLRSE